MAAGTRLAKPARARAPAAQGIPRRQPRVRARALLRLGAVARPRRPARVEALLAQVAVPQAREARRRARAAAAPAALVSRRRTAAPPPGRAAAPTPGRAAAPTPGRAAAPTPGRAAAPARTRDRPARAGAM